MLDPVLNYDDLVVGDEKDVLRMVHADAFAVVQHEYKGDPRTLKDARADLFERHDLIVTAPVPSIKPPSWTRSPPAPVARIRNRLREHAPASPDLAQQMVIGAGTMQQWHITIDDENGETKVRVGLDPRVAG